MGNCFCSIKTLETKNDQSSHHDVLEILKRIIHYALLIHYAKYYTLCFTFVKTCVSPRNSIILILSVRAQYFLAIPSGNFLLRTRAPKYVQLVLTRTDYEAVLGRTKYEYERSKMQIEYESVRGTTDLVRVRLF